ncbi:MAG: putative salt-induced outer membrane protein [Colwellia sp.]|jgi:putative salt-induced outer membrane protein
MFSRFILLSTFALYCATPVLSYAQETQSNSANASDILFSLEKADESKQPVSGTLFTASAQLGILYLTGNTRSADIKTGLDLRFERGLWRSFFVFDLLVKKTEVEEKTSTDDINTNFETTDQKWAITSQTNYTLDAANQNYIYGNIFYEENRFSGFDSQASMSGGWGRRWFENKETSFDADVGPGFKRDVTQVTPEEITAGMTNKTQDTLILQAQALYIRKINEHIEFKQLVVIKHAIEKGQNSIYKAESSITSKLIDSLQLKFNFVIDYNSKVDDDKNNLNTETSAVLIYSF